MNARTNPEFLGFNDSELSSLRIPPHSAEAEASVLGGLLLDNSAFDSIADLLKADDFYRAENKLIYTVISVLVMSTKPADVITVYQHLQNQGKSDEVGGLSYLNSLAQFVPSATNMRRYAEIVQGRSMLRKLVTASDKIATAAFNPQGKDVATILDEAGAIMSGIALGNEVAEWVSTDELVVKLLDLINERSDGTVKDNAIATGLAQLDDILEGGLRPGQLCIIGARPSIGKSALAVTIGLNAALHGGHKVGMFSLEMPKEELVQRQTSMLSHVHLSKIRRPELLTEHDWPRLVEAVEALRLVSFAVAEQSGPNINQIRSKARALKRKQGLDLLIVDYLGLTTGTNTKEPRHQQLGEVSRGLKNLAKELGIPIVALAQLSRGLEQRAGGRPMLSDLKDSGDIEQDADVVIFIDRPHHANPTLGDAWEQYAELIVAKQRNGSCGSVNSRYVGKNVQFLDWDGPKPGKPGRSNGGGL